MKPIVSVFCESEIPIGQSCYTRFVKKVLQIYIIIFAGLIFIGVIVSVYVFGSKNKLDSKNSENTQQMVTPEDNIERVEKPASSEIYQVIKVIDGDTLTVSINGKATTLRLIGINTPETVDPRKPVECFGREASARAHELLDGKSVQLEYDLSQGMLDKYKRTLVYVFREDGLFYNDYIIRQGYAYEYTYNLPYKYQNQFNEAEEEARVNERGLWAPGVCEEPVEPATTQQTQIPAVSPLGSYNCSSNIYNCTDFKTRVEAQAVFDACGGVNYDIHGFDEDGDGQACESLP